MSKLFVCSSEFKLCEINFFGNASLLTLIFIIEREVAGEVATVGSCCVSVGLAEMGVLDRIRNYEWSSEFDK